MTFRQYFLYAQYHHLVTDNVIDLVIQGLTGILDDQFEIDANLLRTGLLMTVHADTGGQYQIADDDPLRFAPLPFPAQVFPIRRHVHARPSLYAAIGNNIVIPRGPRHPGTGAI